MNGFGVAPLELMASDAMLRGQINCEEFTYTASWIAGTATALGANGNVTVETQINGDSDFVVTELNLMAYSAVGTVVANPDLLLMLVAAGAGRQLMDKPVHAMNMCGAYAQDREPGKLTFGRLLAAKNTLSSTLTNRTASAFDFVQIAMKGFKVFYLGDEASRESIFHAL